jgi:hypothetical protein
MKVHILERILFVVIAGTVIFTGLYLYTYLVSIYQSHWVSSHSPHSLLPNRIQLTRCCIATCTSLLSGKWGMAHYVVHPPRSMDTYRITGA